jgi:hypothetical protein
MSSHRFRRALARCRYTLEAVKRSVPRLIVGHQYSVRLVAGGVRQPNPHLPPPTKPSRYAQTAQRLNGLDTDGLPSTRSRLVQVSFILAAKSEHKQQPSADARTITTQKEDGKSFMTSGHEKLTLLEASNCLRVGTLASWRPYGCHDGSGASLGGTGGIQTRYSRIKRHALQSELWTQPAGRDLGSETPVSRPPGRLGFSSSPGLRFWAAL